MRRARRQENVETNNEDLTIENTIEKDMVERFYETYLDYLSQFGSDLRLRIFLERGDNFTSGYLGEILASEVESYNNDLGLFLKQTYGGGLYRVVLVNPSNKKFLAHLKVPVASPKIVSTPNPQITFDEISKARKEGRQEILEVANLMKNTPTQTQPQPPIDLLSVFKLLAEEQSKIRTQENALRERELLILKESLTKTSTPLGEMKEVSEFFKSAIDILNRTARFSQQFTPLTENSEIPIPWWQKLLISLTERVLDNRPDLIEKVLSSLSTMNLNPNALRPIIMKAPNAQNNFSKFSANPNPETSQTEQTPQQNLNSKNPENPQFNFDFVFTAILMKYLKRATRDEDPVFCADSIMSDLDDFLGEKLISETQLNQAYDLLQSDSLEVFAKNFFPDIVNYKVWVLAFQQAIKEGIMEPQDENQNTN